MNTLSIMAFTVLMQTNTMKISIHTNDAVPSSRGLCVKAAHTKKAPAAKRLAMVVTMKEVEMYAFLLSEEGRKRMSELLNPSMLKPDTSVTADMNAVATPISAGVKSREQIIQKTNPKIARTPVESMR